MACVVSIAPPTVSAETVELLTLALAGARRGDVVGVALLLRHPGNDFTLDVAGLVRDDPTFTRGMLAKLDDELGALPPRRA